MVIINNDEVEIKELYPGVYQRPIISRATGSAAITMGEVEIRPGCKIPLHTHKVEDVILLREGSGEILLGDETHSIRENMSILVPAGLKHEVRNTGEVPLKIIFGFPAIEVERQEL
ncbi:MAG: cupin domain-containing protein [Nitrospinota bacterium]